MDISDIEKKLVELDRELHSIMEMVRQAKGHEKELVDYASGAWGYDVDSREYVRKLRRSRRVK